MRKHWLTLVLIVVASLYSLGQSRKHQYRKDRYFFGIQLGTGFMQPIIGERYSLLQATPESANKTYDKQYGHLFQNSGGIYGLHGSFAFTKLFSVLTQPCFQTQRYSYLTNYHWADTILGGELYKELLHRQKIANLRIPVLARMDFSARRFSPFVQAGLSLDIAYFASQIIYSDNYIDYQVDRKTANPSTLAEMTPHVNKVNVYAVGGAGCTYYREQFAVSLSGNIRYGLRSSINDQNRYADYTGFATEFLDVQDQFNLLNLDLMVTVMVPIHKKW